MHARKLMTLHAPLGRMMSEPVLKTMEELRQEHRVQSWWMSHELLPDIVIMAELPADLTAAEPYADRLRRLK